jgi:hypothetical protein
MDALKKLVNDIKDFFTIYYIKHGDELILSFDTITEAEFTASSEVCDYPNERGEYVLDYIYNNPSSLDVVGVISKNSFASILGIGVGNPEDNIKKVEDELKKYVSGIYKLDIKTKTALRTGYTLVKYSIVENVDKFGIFEASMSFREVLDSNIEQKQIKNPKNASNTDTVNSGKTTTKTL